MKRRITISIPENHLEWLDIYFGELDLSIAAQVRLVLHDFVRKVIAEQKQPVSYGSGLE